MHLKQLDAYHLKSEVCEKSEIFGRNEHNITLRKPSLHGPKVDDNDNLIIEDLEDNNILK